MGIRIRPEEIEIPEGGDRDPFEKDLLGRKEPIEILTHLVSTIEGPCVMAVDGPWGSGKTTFINLWYHYLRNKGLNVVRFNAWENDFSDDPFIQLFEELDSFVKEEQLETLGGIWKKLLKRFNQVDLYTNAAKYAGSGALNYMTSGALSLPELFKIGGRR